MKPAGKGLLAILATPKGKADDEGEETDEGKLSAAEDVLSAVKSGDAKALASALDAFHACSGGE